VGNGACYGCLDHLLKIKNKIFVSVIKTGKVGKAQEETK
jgi:hypothetical protein